MAWIALAAGVVLGIGGFIVWAYLFFRYEDRRLIRLRGRPWNPEEDIKPPESVRTYLQIAGVAAIYDWDSGQFVVTRPGVMSINPGITMLVAQTADIADWKQAVQLALRYRL